MAISINKRALGTIQRRRTLCAVTAALAVSLGAMSQAHAADLACKPDIFAKNRKAAAIKVVGLEYTTQATGKGSKTDPWPEALSNKRLAPNEEADWNKVKLQHAAEDNWIRSTRVQYRNDTSGASNPSDAWGEVVWSEWHDHTETYRCLTDRNYAHYIDIGDIESPN
jgi:hypothetical protein